MEDPKKNLKTVIKTTSFGIDPQKAIHSELTEANSHLEELKDTFKGSNAAKVGDFVTSFLDQITPKRGRDYLPDEEMGMIKEELKPIYKKDYLTEEEINTIVKEIESRIYKPEDGITPVKGQDYFTEEEIQQIADFIQSKIKVPEDGKNAEPVDEDRIIKSVVQKIKVKDGKDAIIPKIEDIAKETIKALKNLPEKDKLDISDLRNSVQIQAAIGKINRPGSGFKFSGKDYKFEELMHGGGGGSSVTVAFNYETPLTGTLGVDSVYTFTNSIGQLILNNAVQDPNLDYSGKGTTTATFLNGFIPAGTSLLNVYLS